MLGARFRESLDGSRAARARRRFPIRSHDDPQSVDGASSIGLESHRDARIHFELAFHLCVLIDDELPEFVRPRRDLAHHRDRIGLEGCHYARKDVVSGRRFCGGLRRWSLLASEQRGHLKRKDRDKTKPGHYHQNKWLL